MSQKPKPAIKLFSALATNGKATQQPSVPRAVELDVESIEVPTKHRSIREKKMPGLIDSINAIGLQNPISVREVPQIERLA